MSYLTHIFDVTYCLLRIIRNGFHFCGFCGCVSAGESLTNLAKALEARRRTDGRTTKSNNAQFSKLRGWGWSAAPVAVMGLLEVGKERNRKGREKV